MELNAYITQTVFYAFLWVLKNKSSWLIGEWILRKENIEEKKKVGSFVLLSSVLDVGRESETWVQVTTSSAVCLLSVLG